MTPESIHSSRVPGRRRLYLDTLYDPDRTGRFFQWPHPSPEAFLSCARQVLCDYPVDRKAMAELLIRQNTELGAPPQALKAAEQLKGSQTVCVFTGQQAGLFGGPLYTIYKALTVIGWSQQLRDQLKQPVVPMFWIAADDHDFEEIRWAAFPNQENELQRLTLTIDNLPDRTPASQIRLGESIARLLDDFAKGQQDTEFSNELMAALKSDYSADQTIVESFARWMTRLLGPLGLVVFDPSDPEAKRLCEPLIAEELRSPDETATALADIGFRIEEAGYHHQVAHPDGHTHLFQIKGGRHAIHSENGKLWIDPEGRENARSTSEWLTCLKGCPDAFSPGVLMRPVVQSYLFPVLAAVCGPSEIAYWAQARALFDRFDRTMPVVLPRATATITERNIVRNVRQLDHDICDFFDDIEALINNHFERSFPTDLERQFETERDEIAKKIEQLKATVVDFEPTLAKTFDSTIGRIQSSLEQLEHKVFQAHKRKGEEIRAKFYKLATHLYPEGSPQERVFNIAYYVNKHGFGVVESIRKQLKIGTPDHQLIEP